MPPLQQSNPHDPQLHRSSQILYRCFEEIGSTKGALYCLDAEESAFHLASHYGWPRHFAPPAILSREDPLIQWARRERGPFLVNDPAPYPELDPFREASLNARFILAPIYDRGRWIGLLLQRDRDRGVPYTEERDIPLTLSICQELSEALGEPSLKPPQKTIQDSQPPLPVEAPPSEAMVSTLAGVPILSQESPRRILAGTFLPEQRVFFWEAASALFQVLQLQAVGLWMEEPAEIRPILVFSHHPLSASLKQEILATVASQTPDITAGSLRILPRVESPAQEPLNGSFRIGLPVVLEEEGGGRDLLMLFRIADQPFSEPELAFIRCMARLVGCHLQESRLHERYHRAFLSVSQRILGSAEGLRTHCLNTARLARNLALRIGLPSSVVEAISISAILHDVGSLLLDPEFQKKGKLDPDELERVRAHPVLASTFLKDFQFPFDVPNIIRHHHERWDGKGYPDGLAGEEIPIGSRLIALIEAYEVMTAGSTYRTPMSKTDALEEIRRNAGTQFDPALAQEFLTMAGPGTR